jgi:23S rRNA pseudouridine955/2504/2580 synthase
MKRYHTRIPVALRKVRLDQFLLDWLPQAMGKPLSRTTLRNLFISGSVYVNRHRQKKALTEVYSGAVIEVYYDSDKASQKGGTRLIDARIDPDTIVYEDEWLIVVNKPSGLPTQPTLDPGRANLYDLMGKHLSGRHPSGQAYVGLHHRLDKDTSGLVLFTKREEANKGVSELFSEHRIRKTYHCLCWRSPGAPALEAEREFEVRNYLGKVSEFQGKKKYGAVSSGGDLALTRFRPIKVFRDMVWLTAMPETGRTHQIRVHASENGLPILGDTLYFPENLHPLIAVPRLLLHAARLEFEHPMTGAPIKVECALPGEFIGTLSQGKE